MIGGFEFQPPGKIAPRLAVRPGVRFGKPLDFSRYYGLEQDHLVLRAMTDEIMYELMKLSGQEYVDEYAQRAKVRVADRLRHDGHGRSKADGSGHDHDQDLGDQAEQAGAPERVGAAETDDD